VREREQPNHSVLCVKKKKKKKKKKRSQINPKHNKQNA